VHRKASGEIRAEPLQPDPFTVTSDNVFDWTRHICDQIALLIEHFFTKHFRRETAQMSQLDSASELFDDLSAILQTPLFQTEHIKHVISCLEVFSSHISFCFFLLTHDLGFISIRVDRSTTSGTISWSCFIQSKEER
jgi:hypothetical protein